MYLEVILGHLFYETNYRLFVAVRQENRHKLFYIKPFQEGFNSLNWILPVPWSNISSGVNLK